MCMHGGDDLALPTDNHGQTSQSASHSLTFSDDNSSSYSVILCIISIVVGGGVTDFNITKYDTTSYSDRNFQLKNSRHFYMSKLNTNFNMFCIAPLN